MSIIMAAGNKSGIIIIADSRCVWSNDNGKQIIQEDYEKIIKASDGTCIAFAGSVMHCIPVVNELCDMIQQHKIRGVETYTEFCAMTASNMMELDPSTNIQMIIAGRTCNDELAYGALTYYSNVQETTITKCTNDDLYYTVRSCLDPKDDFIGPIMQQTQYSVISRMRLCVQVASMKSDYINNRIREEFIRN